MNVNYGSNNDMDQTNRKYFGKPTVDSLNKIQKSMNEYFL